MNLSPTKYLGKSKHTRSLKNYYLSISYHEKEAEIPRHSHTNPYLSLNLGPAYLENDGYSKNIIESGNVIIRPSLYKHQNIFNKESGICFNIELTSKDSQEILVSFSKKNIHFSCFDIIKILTRSFDDYLDHELDCFITETILQYVEMQHTKEIPVWYAEVIDIVRDDYTSALSLNSIATRVSLHPNYLARKFKQINGNSLGDYIRNTRLENALLKLYSKERLTDISLDTGFCDQSHFSNSFRSSFNFSPKQLRNKLLG